MATKRKNPPNLGAQVSAGAPAPPNGKPERNARETSGVRPLKSAAAATPSARAAAPKKPTRTPKAAVATPRAKPKPEPKPKPDTARVHESPAYRVPVSIAIEPESAVEEMLGVAAAPLDTFDPAGFARMLIETAREATKHPRDLVGAVSRFGLGLANASAATAGRALGRNPAGPVKPKPKDRRFADPTWQQNPAYFLALQLYLLGDQLAMQLIDAAHLEPADDRKARFAAQFLLDAISPTNTLAGNPVALRTAF